MRSYPGMIAAGAACLSCAGISCAVAAITTTSDRAAFIASIHVQHEEDFNGFFGAGAGPWAAVNFGASSLTFFRPITYSATNGGYAQLFGPAYHDGDTAVAVIDGTDSIAVIDLGATYTAVGIDLLRANFSSPAASYRVRLRRAGVAVDAAVTAPAVSFLGITSDEPFDAVTVQAISETGGSAREVFDNIVMGAGATGPCNAADVAEPFGLLDLSDITAFVSAFAAGDSLADLAEPAGLLDLADIGAFVSGFDAGCP